MTALAALPPRPDAPAGARPARRRWLPTLVVAATIAATVLGGFVVAEALPAPEVRPLRVGGVLTLRPLPGWEVVRREDATMPAPSGSAATGEFVQLSRGSGALDLLAVPGLGGDARDLAERYVDEVLSHQLERLSVSGLDEVPLADGLAGARFGYIGTEPSTGSPIEGVVTTVVAPSGNAAAFDGWAFQGQLELFVEELSVMIDRAEVV